MTAEEMFGAIAQVNIEKEELLKEAEEQKKAEEEAAAKKAEEAEEDAEEGGVQEIEMGDDSDLTEDNVR